MPSKRRRRAAADPPKTTAAFEIPEEERFRIIEETGILDDPPAAGPSTEPLLSFSDDELVDKPGLDEEDAEVEEEDTLPVWVDSACDTFMFLIPFTSLFIVMDILVHKQYGQALTPQLALGRVVNFVPGLAILIHYTLRHPSHWMTRILFLLFSGVGGSVMIRLVNKDSYLKIMRRCPALGTLWVYAIVRMELLDAVLSLLAVGAYCWYDGLKIIF